MRTLLIHIAQGYSLRETAVKAKAAGIADVSDVALLKRLRLAEHWFKTLCQHLLTERKIAKCSSFRPIQMRLVDATHVKEPGKTGSIWRIHYSLTLPDLQCDYFSLTRTNGQGVGETYKKYPAKKGDCVIGDRGYSLALGIEYLNDLEAFCLVRVNTQSLNFYTEAQKEFDLMPHVKTLQADGQIGEWVVGVKKADGSLIQGRICGVRKSEQAIKDALKKLKDKASKKQRTYKPETLEYAKYIIVFTTLPAKHFSSVSIMEWYRLRWQIELVFKRLKLLAGLGHLPKYDEASSRAWLYGKLFVGLLGEKLIDYANNISPWSYCLGERKN
jgi:hypothetical protein